MMFTKLSRFKKSFNSRSTSIHTETI